MSVPAPATATQARHGPGFLSVALWSVSFFLVACGFFVPYPAKCPELSTKEQPHIRWPVAWAWIDFNNRQAVANRCGTISIVDLAKREVIEELPVGEKLVDIIRYPSGRLWLTVDSRRHELISLKRERNSLRVVARHRVSSHPASIAVSYKHNRIAVASLWSRVVTIFETVDDPKKQDSSLRQLAVLSLDFNPGEMFFRADDDGYLVVDDAFFGHTALINTVASKPHVAPASQALAERARADGTSSYSWSSPGFLAHYQATRVVYERNRSIIDDVENYEFRGTVIPLGAAMELTPAQRGEIHFYDRASESSCHTCHIHGHTSYKLEDTLADGTTNTPKRIPTLLGTRLSDPWAWNGRFRNLDEQVKSSLETTMHVQNVTPQQIGDLTAFLHTLPPPPPLEPATDDPADQEWLARGKDLFTSLGCAKCHVPPLTYTSPDTYDVGLADEAGMTKFNPPSLRGVSQGYAFFHDARAKTLEEVFTTHGHQLPRDLEKQELSDLLRFLRSL